MEKNEENFFDKNTVEKLEVKENFILDLSKSNIINQSEINNNLDISGSFFNDAEDIIDIKSNKSSLSKKKKSDSSSSSKSSSSHSHSSSFSESPNANKRNIEEEEKEEIKNLKIHKIKIVDKTIPFETLISKNKDHIFLMNKNSKNEKINESLEKILKNFSTSESIINNYKKEILKEEKKEFFKRNGFVLTNNSIERISLLIHYILTGIPILLEGNTGTAKTRTAIVAFKYIKEHINSNLEIIRYNLSRETKIDDLMSKYVGDSETLVGLKIKNGPFLDAYINGKILLLDEINLAQSKVLQCIQQALDNGFISVETNGKGLVRHEMNENFCLIATQNPNKGGFIGKRQDLEMEFLSRFQKIYFNEIQINEMNEIAIGIAKNLGYLNGEDDKNKSELINDIVELHYKWSKENESENDIQCFTIREIETVIEALNNNNNLYDVLMTVYGGRYFKNKKQKLSQEFSNFKNLKNLIIPEKILDKDFPECFPNKSLIETISSVLLSLNNKRNVLIVGNSESGLTQLAKWCSIYYNKKIIKNEKVNEKEDKKKYEKNYICYCTKNLERSDLIGSQKFYTSKGFTTEILKFKRGILYKAMESGISIVLDNINEAPSRVIERLNDILDKKNDKNEMLEIPENTNEPNLRIDDNFRIICTSNYDKLSEMTPAFINRFEVVVLENQLNNLTDDDLMKLIKFEFDFFQKELMDNFNYIKKTDNNKNEKKEYKSKNEEIGEISKIIQKNNHFKMNKIFEGYYGIVSDKIKLLKSYENKIDKEYDENSKKYLSFSNIAKFCRAIIIFINKFNNKNYDIKAENIVDFCFELLFEKEISEKNRQIKDILKKELKESYDKIDGGKFKNEEKYFFLKSAKLTNLMIHLYASSLINQHLCIIGPPGIGKTLGSRAFALIREVITKRKYESPFYMNTFNEHTRPNDYFGVASLKDDKLVFKDGNLTKSIKQGNIFIADEFNIASEDCMKCISPALELNYSNNIYIPGVEGKVKMDPEFFFIICQNSKDIYGRKDLPDNIKNKVKVIFYPERIKEEIEIICVDMYKYIFLKNNIEIEKEKEIKLFGTFMMKINENRKIIPWSLRDIYKLFKRLYYQSKNENKFEGLGIKENILYYILSSIHESQISELLPIIIKLMKEVYQLKEEDEKNLYKLYKSIPQIVNNSGKYLFKKDYIKINLDKIGEDTYNKIKVLPTLLEAYFKILISSKDEPILLCGPSSYKTFLSKLVFNKSKYEIISLNSESSIPQLIGSTILLTKDEAKAYYLRQILELLQVNNIENQLLEINDKKKIESIINEKMEEKNKYFIFDYALNNFKSKFFKEENKNSLFDMVLEFKPGIFISSRIRGHNLILKNITSVKTENFERLNEVLTGNKKITLNEDVQNSFTPEDNKEISFNENFRIICTCQEGEEGKLSQSFKSRLSLIYIQCYTHEEEKIVVNNESEFNDEEILDEKIYNSQNRLNIENNEINLSKKLNCIKLAKKLDNEDKDSHQKYLKLSLYYLIKGFLDKKEKYLKDLNDIFSFNYNYNNSINKPILFESKIDNNESIITSSFSNLSIKQILRNKKDDYKVSNKTIVFNQKFNDLLDVIHFGILTKIPIILEGNYGQGKYTAIEYYSKLVGFEILRISITKSTKVDDLLYKTILKNKDGSQKLAYEKTPLCQAIECKEVSPNKLVLIEGINNSSPAILDILNLIFGPSNTNILLPNGSTIIKGNINLIGIFNPSIDNTRDKLPNSLKNNCLYYIVDNPSKKDIKLIVEKLFEEEKLSNDEANLFLSNYFKVKKIAENDSDELPITLNVVKKYLQFRKKIPGLNKNIFMSFIFQHHFIKYESIQKIKRELKLSDYNIDMTIEYSGNNKYLNLKINNKNQDIKVEIKNPENINQEENIKLFNSLTQSEQFGFLFLLCCVLIKKVPIIQGETASGKSYLLNIFAKIMGEKLLVYQMNENTGLSIFTGQSIINENLNENEKNEIIKISNLLKIKNFEDSINKISGKDISKMMKKLIKKEEENKDNKEAKNGYTKLKNILLKITSPVNRFIHRDSEFIKSVKDGGWILLDGMEHSPIIISEKLSSFCEDNPSLNIYESGTEDLKFESKDINDNFKLFMIYNPLSSSSKPIDISMMHKCIKFSLVSIDSKPSDAGVILYNGFSRLNLINDIFLKYELSNRIISYHFEQIKKTKEKPELVAGNIPFTSRNLYFISKDYYHVFNNKNNDSITLETWLYSIFENYYWRSYIHYSQGYKNGFINESLKLLMKKPENGFAKKMEMNKEIQFKEISEILIGIQNYACNNIEYNFSFIYFIQNCLKLPLNEEILKWVINNIEDTINLLNNNNKMSNEVKSNLYQIIIIKNIFNELIDNIQNLDECVSNKELLSEDLLNIKEIKPIIMKLKLLYMLLKSKSEKKINIYLESINYKLFSPLCIELCFVLNKFISSPNKNNFFELAKLIFKNPDFFNLLEILYPFNLNKINKNETTKCVSQLIYTWTNLYKYKNNFSLTIENNKYEIIFNEDQKSEICAHFILHEKENIYLSKGSYLAIYDLSEREYKKYFFEGVSKEKTNEILATIINSLNDILRVTIDRYEKKDKIFQTTNFFLDKSNSEISRIWPIIFNLSYEQDILTYIERFLCDIEKDILEKLLLIYNNLDKTNLEDIITNMKRINFFCNNNTSILWKYRDRYFDNISENDCNNDLKNLEIEKNSIENLFDLWSMEEIDKYKNKLNEINIELLSIKDKNEKNKMALELKNRAKELIYKLNGLKENKDIIIFHEKKKNSKKRKNKDFDTKVNKNFEKQMMYIQEDIKKFMEMEEPTEKNLEELELKVKIFTDICHTNVQIEGERIFWPVSDILKKNILSENVLKIDEYIFWYSEMKKNIDIITTPNISENIFFEHILKLYKDNELESIINYINEKKSNSKDKNYIFLENDIKIINSILRSIFLKKLFKEGLNKDKIDRLNNFIDYLNKEINPIEISEENYIFINSIANKYPYELKIICPSFESDDVFYLFFKYVNKNNFSKNEFIQDLKISNKKINKIISDIYIYNNLKDLSMSQIAEKIIYALYENIYDKKVNFKFNFENNFDSVKDKNEKKFLLKMKEYLLIFKYFEEIINKQKNNDKKFICTDIIQFKNFNKENIISSLLRKGKDNINNILIYYINEHKEECEEIFNKIMKNADIISKNLGKNNECDYIPFWLYVLRKISSINCIEINDNENTIKKYIKEQVKEKIKNYISENKYIGTDWINLISSDISNELLKPTIRNIAIFFENLCYNIRNEFKKFEYEIISLIKKLYNNLIELVFNNNLVNLIENKPLSSNDLLIKFIRNPSNYIYSIIKETICDIFKKEFNKENKYLEEIDYFLNNGIIIYQEIDKDTKKLNKSYKKKEYDIQLELYRKQLDNQVDYLYKLINRYNEILEKINNRDKNNDSFKFQILDNEYKEINKIIEELNKFKLYDLQKNNDNILELYIIPFDFDKIKENKINILYNEQIVEIKENDKNELYILPRSDINDITFNFNLTKNKTNLNLNEVLYFDKSTKYKIINMIKIQRSQILYQVKKIIIFDINVTENCPEVLFNNYKWEQLSREIDNLFNNTKEEIKKSFKEILNSFDFKLLDEFIEKLKYLLKNISNIKAYLKPDKDYGEKFAKNLKEYDSLLDRFYNNTQSLFAIFENGSYNLYKNISKLDESSVFKENYSFPLLPEEKIISKADIEDINLKNDSSCIPTICILNKDEGNKIEFSLNEIKLDLGEITLYEYEKPITIKVLSFIDEEIKTSIAEQYMTSNEKKDNDDANNSLNNSIKDIKVQKKVKYMNTKEKLKPKEDIEIYIDIHNLNYIKEISIILDGKLCIELLSSQKKFYIDINISMKIIPIKLILKSLSKYKLEIDEERKIQDNSLNIYYKLDTDELNSGETIEFFIENYNEDSDLSYVVCLKSLENNISEKPIINWTKEGKIKMIIPNLKNEITPRINCDLVITFINNVSIYISIDALIKNNFFLIQMYDYFLKKYIERESNIYLSPSSISILAEGEIPINLNFLLYSSFLFKEKVNINLKSEFPDEIKLEFPKEDIIINETIIKFQMKLKISYLLLNDDDKYQIKLLFKVREREIEYIINIFHYKTIKGNIIKLKEIKNNDKDKNFYQVSPFEPKPYMNYNHNKKRLCYPSNINLDILILNNSEIKKFSSFSFKPNLIQNCQLCEIYLDDIFPLICIYKDDWFPLITFNKDDFYYIKEPDLYSPEKLQNLINKGGFSELIKDLRKNKILKNKLNSKINDLLKEFKIKDSKDVNEIKAEKDQKVFYKDLTKIINNEIIEELINEFEDYLPEKNKKHEEKNIISNFTYIARELYKNRHLIQSIKKQFPEKISLEVNDKSENYDFNYNYSTFLSIVKLREILYEKYKRNGFILGSYLKNLLSIQKNLLLELYIDKIDDKESEIPSIVQKLNTMNNSFKESKYNHNDEKIIHGNENQENRQISSAYIIEGDFAYPLPENFIKDKNSINENIELNNTMIIEKVSIVELPEISIPKEINEKINLNSLKDEYDKYIKCARGFPSYLKYVLSNLPNDKQAKRKAKNYLDIMISLYSKTFKYKDGKSLMKDKINEFNNAFEVTIQILKNGGLELNNLDFIKKIKSNSKINSFIIFPEKKVIEPRWDSWEKRIYNNKIENNYKNISLFNKYETHNELGILKTNKYDEKILNNLDNNNGINVNSIKNDNENMNQNDKKSQIDDDFSSEDEIPEKIRKDEIISSDDEKEEDQKPIGNNNLFISSKKLSNKDSDKRSAFREKFEKLESHFNEDYAIQYIVNKIKNKIDENDMYFEYEKNKKELKGFEPPKELLNNKINLKHLPVIDLLEDSRFITSRIITSISQYNVDQENFEINFSNLEIHILFDCTRLISNENKYFNLLLICGLANCCYSLGISYSLSLIGDSDFQIRIKSTYEEHSEIALQALLDCAFLKRNITQLPASIKYFIDKYPPKEKEKNRAYYIFTNGFDEELRKINAWKTKIFNDSRNSFNFIFLKSKILDKQDNLEYKNFFEGEWQKFKEKTKILNSKVKISILSMEDIFNENKIEDFIKNISYCLLREKGDKDTSLKNKASFSIDEIKNIDKKYLFSFSSNLGDQLNNEEFNEIYIKKNKLPSILDTQKEDNKEFSEFCQNTGKLIKCKFSGYQPEISDLIKKFLISKTKINKSLLNIIFKPNLPTQEILCEEGTHLDVTELIKYSINKVPNPKLYREIKDGLIKNYGATIVIDSSLSCLNEFSKYHTLLTISVLLSALYYDNISCFDLVISTNKEPIVICSGKIGSQILSEKSQFWIALFSLLKGYKNSDLASGIKSAFNIIRARRRELTNNIYVITDGLYNPSQRERIIGVVNNCYYRNINIFGIGVGIYPIGIEKLFPQVLYAQNPYKLVEALSLCFGDISKYKNNKMNSLYFKVNQEHILEKVQKYSESIKNVYFKELKDRLNKIKITLESFAFYQPELQLKKNNENPLGENDGMYPRNFFKGQHILIAMFYSSDLKSEADGFFDKNEQKINPVNIILKMGDNECISSALEYYGYEVDVVTNYEDAIMELTRTNLNGKCFYNSLWIISGREIEDLPSDKGDRYAACYVEQFIDCSLAFWKNGGSIFLMAENDPYNFQANLFLKKAVFPGNRKLQFRLKGNSPGGKILIPSNDGYLRNGTFMKKKQEFENIERKSISNNLIKIFEGITLCYAEGNLYPFIPFSKDSSGYYNSMFYNGSDNGNGLGEGDIFIDCSYSKFFLDMTKEGTLRYLQNISAYLGSPERRINTGRHPKDFRPERVIYNLNKNYNLHYKYRKIPFDLLYLVDATGSMDPSIEQVKRYCVEISNILNEKLKRFNFKFGAVFYRDPAMKNDIKNQNDFIDFTEDSNILENFISRITAHGGGGDGPEDWVSAYSIVLNCMSWRNGVKFIIHIADSPAHGSPNDYGNFDCYSLPQEAFKLDKLIEKLARDKYFITGFWIKNYALKSFINCQRIFDLNKNPNYDIKYFNPENPSQKYFTNLVISSSIGVARTIN